MSASAGIAWGRAPAILHLDLDAFFASVEQLRLPALRGRPVVVGSGVIASCSYEARRFGLGAGMSLSQARRLCPGVVILAGHAQTYRCFAEAVFAIAARFSPALETFLDEAYLELTGTARVHAGGYLGAGERLRSAVREEVGLPVSVGIATNRMVAKMVTRGVKPDGFGFCPPGGEDEFVAGRKAEELPGIGHRTAAILQQLNVHSVQDLRGLSESTLCELFGASGRQIFQRCRGRDTAALSRREIPQSVRRETSLHQPSCEPSELEAMLHYLTTRGMREVRRLGLAVRTVRVHLHYQDGEAVARAQSLAWPTMLDEEIFGRARRLLELLFTRRMAVRNLGLELSHLGPAAGEQLGLLEGPGRRARRCDLEEAIDGLRDRFGFASLTDGPSLRLLNKLPRDRHGFLLRTSSLTR